MTRKFVESGVLIAAARSQSELAEPALEILIDPEREFVSRVFVRMEDLPKPVHYGRTLEAEFMRLYFEQMAYWSGPLEEIVALAEQHAEAFGLSAMDALHVAAAKLDGAEEFITTERPNSPIHRVTGIRILSIYHP